MELNKLDLSGNAVQPAEHKHLFPLLSYPVILANLAQEQDIVDALSELVGASILEVKSARCEQVIGARPLTHKQVVFDVVVSGYAGELGEITIDLEIQNKREKFLEQRILYYLSAITHQYALHEGEQYCKMRKSFVAFLCVENAGIGPDPRYDLSYEWSGSSGGDCSLGNRFVGAVVNLKEFRTRSGPLAKLARAILGDASALPRLETVASEISNKREVRDSMSRFDIDETREQELLDVGREEGREEGMAKGREEGLTQGREEGIALIVARMFSSLGDVDKVATIAKLKRDVVVRLLKGQGLL